MSSLSEDIFSQTTPKKHDALSGEEVVISGMSGIFPSSNSVFEFMENLYNEVDMVTDDNTRWSLDNKELPKHIGMINGMSKFDAQFFRVHYKQACTMEPMSRKLLEHAYSAIFDSGINPLQLRGKKVGVFIGSSFSESEKIVIYESIQSNGFGITGCNKSMYANRISYWIDGKGPSYCLDLACASSMACVEHAYKSIKSGQCDAAIVGGCNLCMHPHVTLNFKRAGFLCHDGKTKCFDKHGDGYVRSDAVGVLFLQKSKDAKRIYSEVYYAKQNYTLKSGAPFLPIREVDDIKNFLETFYKEINISPDDVEYVEGFGSGIAQSDINELIAIGKVFGKNKTIKVGSVTSNMGHSEPASGICALTKVCVAYHKGKIPANLHCNNPADHISEVRDGKVQVLQDHSPFQRGYTALNSFSYSGANIHVLLKGHHKEKDPERYQTSIPRLVLLSGRQEDCVTSIINDLKKQPIDPEQIGLLHNIFQNDIPGHMCKGYTVLDKNDENKTVCLSESFKYFDGLVQPVWFVYSGMGSQWAGMGAELMRIPTFAAAIERCRRVLAPKGIDIVNILTSNDKTIYDNILNSFVGIAAVQIGLTDILNEMGIVPDHIIGHSVGELGCAYADGCFTAEEMILSAYSRGLVSVQTPFIKGAMAAVGLGYSAVLPLCPPEIEVACHNSSESSTISGPSDVMKQFVSELTSRGVFAREVPCSNIAYHSKYIADAGPGLLKYLSEVITDPKPRSKKWVSTSVPQEKWNNPAAKYSSAEYHTNNLLNPVLFEETSKLLPSYATVIEIAPHGLLQAILKRTHSECTHVPLTRRGHSDPVLYFLDAVGKLYQAGLNPKVDVLYPKIQYPVSTETPFLSHLVKWEHSETWPEAKYNVRDKVIANKRNFVLSIQDDDYKYFEGYKREGQHVYPEAAIIVLIWETYAMAKGMDYRKMSVNFKDVKFEGEAAIQNNTPMRLTVMIQKGNNYFEVSYEKVRIASGVIQDETKTSFVDDCEENYVKDTQNIILSNKDIYKVFYQKGYSFRNQFQNLLSINANYDRATIQWSDDWVTFLDAIFQMITFRRNHNGISLPKFFKKLSICIDEHIKSIKSKDCVYYYDAIHNNKLCITRCGGVELFDIVVTDKPKAVLVPDILQTTTFVPHFLKGNINVETALQIYLQIISENISSSRIKITEFTPQISEEISSTIRQVTDYIPLADFDVTTISIDQSNADNILSEHTSLHESDVFVVHNLLGDKTRMKNIYNIMTNDSFVMVLESDVAVIYPKHNLFTFISAMSLGKKILILLKKSQINNDEKTVYIPITHDSSFSWVPRIKSELKKSQRVVLITERQPYSGLIGLTKSLNKSYHGKLSLVFVDDCHAPKFSSENNIFKDQIQKKISINVLRKGLWGGFYYVPSEISTKLLSIELYSSVPGDLDSLRWIEHQPTLEANPNIVQVSYAGLSKKDVLLAVSSGTSQVKGFGMDYSGIDSNGQKVMGVVPGGAISTTVVADPDLTWPIPSHWSLDDAATVPLPYVIACYCLIVKGNINSKHTILVNGGAGAVGQAIISVALSLGCVVYTVVSNKQKKDLLLKLFPALNETNVGYSRDITFYDMIRMKANNNNCDIVINCATSRLREASMNCVGRHGFFMDLTDSDVKENDKFGMSYFQFERSYMSVQILSLFKAVNKEQKLSLQHLIAEGIANGWVKPLTRVVYPFNEVTKAFRLVSSSRHMGRVLIDMKSSMITPNMKITPKIKYFDSGSYVVVCKESDLCIELIDQLISNGAKNINVNVKPNDVSGYFQTKIVSWKNLGVKVKLSSYFLQTEKGCADLFKEASTNTHVRGIFIVLDTTKEVTDELDREQFEDEFDKIAMVVVNLDFISRHDCPLLSYFAVLTHGPQNAIDSFNTSTIERICQTRHDLGFPSLFYHNELIDRIEQKGENVGMKLQPQTFSVVLKGLEIGLKLKQSSILSYNLKRNKTINFLKKIEKTLGLKNINDVSPHLTLKDFIINDTNIEEVKSVIRETFKLNYPTERILNMSVRSIKKINDELCNKIHNFDGGLGAFYTYIDNDECLATEPVISMRTKLSNDEKAEDLDPNATYLMIIPGFEGHQQMFELISERLKVNAVTFQTGPDLSYESIPQLASDVLKVIKTRFNLKSKFYLMGYSFGVNVALELAALLEKDGLTGVVYCLDSSPDALRAQLDAYLGDLTEAELQNTIVEHMYRLMSGHSSDELSSDLQRAERWSDKIQACLNRLKSLRKYSIQYKHSILKTAYQKIVLARQYKPEIKLQSPIVLIKGIPHPEQKQLPDDYNLSKYTAQPVQVFNIESDHASAPQDCKVSNIINKLLDSSLLEHFDKQNLCEHYIADPTKMC